MQLEFSWCEVVDLSVSLTAREVIDSQIQNVDIPLDRDRHQSKESEKIGKQIDFQA